MPDQRNTTLPTLIASDWHLGGPDAQPKRILDTLKRVPCSRFMMLGDMYNDPSSHRLPADVRALEEFIKNISVPKIFIEGNHDFQHLNSYIPDLGFTLYPQDTYYAWELNGHRHIAIHGLQFDGWVFRYPWLTRTADRFINHFKEWFPRLGHYFDQKARERPHKVPRMIRGAVAFAKKHGADRIYIGHHHAHTSIERVDGIEVINVGCMTNKPHEQFSYTLENPDGRVEFVNEPNPA